MNAIRQINNIRQSFTMFKPKKINVASDDDWILCELNNTTKTIPISKFNVLKNTNTDESVIKLKLNLISQYNVCKNANIDVPVIDIKTTTVDVPVNETKTTTIDDNKINTLVNNTLNNYNFISILYESFMDIIYEIDTFKIFFIFGEKRIPIIFI